MGSRALFTKGYVLSISESQREAYYVLDVSRGESEDGCQVERGRTGTYLT
jgi:hypothetical protein